MGKDISADCEVTWDIGDGEVWTHDPSRDWLPKVALRLHWKEDVVTIGAAAIERGTLFAGALLTHANFAFEAGRAALPAGETGQPHSFLPKLRHPGRQTVRFALYGSPIAARVDANGLLSWGRPKDEKGNLTGPWKRPPMRLSLIRPEHLIARDKEGVDTDLALAAGGMSFFESDGANFDLKLSHDPKWPPTSVDTVEDGEPFFASFAAELTGTLEPWRGRLASLEFHALDKIDPKSASRDHMPKDLNGHLRLGGVGARDGFGSGRPDLIYPKGRISAEFRIIVPVSVVRPVGIDTSRFDRSGRAAPLLIPLDGQNISGRYWLDATETLSARHDRQLRADIYESTPDASKSGDESLHRGDFAVLSSEPFSVFRFRHQPLADRGRDDTAAVATYSGDDRIWQYRVVSRYYHYILPPQSIGESADKPRRLEIHDLEEHSSEEPPRPFQRSYKKDQDGKEIFDEDTSSLRRRAVEQRLTPPAEIWISPSDVERGYFMPEATSYEIFRQAGSYGLGAALAFLRAEFLYGMSVGIDVSKEGFIARGARVAEIEAMVGRLAGPARENDADRNLADRWNALRAAVARRPERLEIWARDTGSKVDFTPARFSDGVNFALRGTALHRPPLIDKTINDGKQDSKNGKPESKQDYCAWPKVGLGNGDNEEEVATTPPSKPRHHPQGLSGGALWPVESINLFKTLLDQPQCAGGTIEQIALSPLGGDAVQKAEFLGGQVSIISETRNGRVQRQQVEVIGRICALWHRAKHVVVYERTVNASAQFAPKFEVDCKRTRSRRPILRKVSEYIELLQPVRSYPDFSTGTQRSAGFLERVRFNSTVINVDSAWATEVDNSGWQIPLWNRQAARERPQVYAMPDVSFVSTAEGEGDKPCVAQDCRDTDMLFFFADFKAKTSDTDQWKPRLGLDYVNLPSAKAISNLFDKASEPTRDEQYGHDSRRRAVSRFLPGLRRFTWRLAPATQKTAINAGRAAKPVYVELDSVSFMRAGHTDLTKHKKLTPELSGALGLSVSVPTEFTALGYWSSDGDGINLGSAKKLSEIVGPKGSLIETIRKSPGQIAVQLTELENLWTGKNGKLSVKEDLKNIAKKEDKSTNVDLPDLTKFKSGITSGALCEKLKNNAVKVIQCKEMLISSALQDWIGEIGEKLAELQHLAESKSKQKSEPKPKSDSEQAAEFLGKTKSEVISNLKQKAIEHIRPLFAEASQDIARIDEGVEKARAVVLDVEVEIEQIVTRARRRVDQFNAAYEGDKPWSQERRKAFRSGIEACIGSVAVDISSAVDEAAQRLATELNNASQSLAGHVAKFLTQVKLPVPVPKLTTVGAVVKGLLEKVDSNLEKLQSRANNVVGKLPDLVVEITNDVHLTHEQRAELLNAVAVASATVENGRAQLATMRLLAIGFDDLVDSSIGGVKDAVDSVVNPLNTLGQNLIKATKDLAHLAANLDEHIFTEIRSDVDLVSALISKEINPCVDQVDADLAGIGKEVDAVILPAMRWLDATLANANCELRGIPSKILPIIDDLQGALQSVKDNLTPDKLLDSIVAQLIKNALDVSLAPLPTVIDSTKAEDVTRQILLIRKRLQLLIEEFSSRIREVGPSALGPLDTVTAACNAVSEGVAEVEAYFKDLGDGAVKYLGDKLDAAYGGLRKAYENFKVEQLIAAVGDFDRAVRGLHNDLGRVQQTADAYKDRVLDAAGKLGDGDLMAAPNNILKLYSAVTSAPELGALKTDIDRIRSTYDEASDIIGTTKANALFDQLSDELKAIGLSLPFDQIGDSLLPSVDITGLDIGEVIRNFGGAKLFTLLKDARSRPGCETR